MRRAGVTLVCAAVLCGACGGSGPSTNPPASGTAKPPPSSAPSTLVPDLDTYTDRGDGCPQVVSAIGYVDEAVLPRGQESRQVFDDAVRSRLAAVSGTIALELDDFPSSAVRSQARVVRPLASKAGALIDEKSSAAVRSRLRTFVRYREEAARLVETCQAASAAQKKLPSSPATERPASP